MALKEYSPNNTIDLSGPDGNVFNLIGVAQHLAKKLDKNSKDIVAEMMSADYGNALFVFEREFGEFVDLKLPEGMTAKDIKNSYLKKSMSPEQMSEVYKK